MKDLTKYYIDLSKCTEEQRKYIFSLLPAQTESAQYVVAGPFINLHFKDKRWVTDTNTDDKQELTYTEFIKLFEGGEGEKKERLYTLDEMSKCWIQATRKTHEPIIESGFSKFIESLNSNQ